MAGEAVTYAFADYPASASWDEPAIASPAEVRQHHMKGLQDARWQLHKRSGGLYLSNRL